MSELTIKVEPASYGRHVVEVSNGEALHVDEFKPTRAKDRAAFVMAVVDKHPGLSDYADELDRRIVEEAAQVKRGESEPEAPPRRTANSGQATGRDAGRHHQGRQQTA